MDIRQTNCPSRHKGTLGTLGGQTFKRVEKLSNGWTDWPQLWNTSSDSSGNGHRLNTSRPTIPQGSFWGHKCKCILAVKRLDRLAPTVVHVCGFVWEWTYNSPFNVTGVFRGVLGGHRFKSGKAAKRMGLLAPNSVHVCRSIWKWT